MIRRAFGALTFMLAALAGVSCSLKGGEEERVKALEARVMRLEERLADMPAAAADLATADVDELAERLDSGDAIVRYRAGKALAGRMAEARPVLLDLLKAGTRRQKQAAAQVLAEAAPPEAVADLVAAHGRDLDSKSRAWLDLALARTGQPEAFDPLVADLGSPSQTVRIAAVQGLSRLKDAHAAIPLVNAAIAGDPIVASLARQALHELDDTSALFVETQWEVLGPRERQSVVEAMGPIPGERVGTFLEAHLADASPRVALEAALQLARRGSMAGREVAFERLSSDDAILARIARDVLDAIEANHGSEELPQAAP